MISSLFAYDKTTDSKNVYYSSEHFRTVIGLSYINSTSLESFSDKILLAAEKSWNIEVEQFGFKHPINTDIKKIDIYIGNKSAYNYETKSYETISSSYAGWAVSYPSDNTPYFLLNPSLTDNQLKVTISHEFFHTIQFAYFDEKKIDDLKWKKNIWWLESTAVLMEDEVYDEINDYINFLEPFFKKSYLSFEIYNGSHEYAMVIFAKYLREKYGLQIFKDTFKKIETSKDDGYFEILDILLKTDYNTNMEIELGQFAIWVSNAIEHFKDGNLYPTLIKFNLKDNKVISKGGILCLNNSEENLIFSNNYYLKSYSDYNELLISNKNNFDVTIGIVNNFKFFDSFGYIEKVEIKSKEAVEL